MPGVDDSSGPLSKADKDEAPSYTIPSTIESASYSKSGSTGPNPFSHLVEKLSVWVSIVTAVLSLVISIYTLVITTYEPELLLIMPNQVRIGQGGDSGPLLYIQPMIISTGLSERVEVITGIRVQVEAMDQSQSHVEFVWDEQGTWVVDPSTQNFNWVFTGDSGPFLVSAKNAKDFTGLFIGPDDWLFEPGTYRITMIADRITNRQPLTATIEILLSNESVDYLNQSQGTRFLVFPGSK